MAKDEPGECGLAHRQVSPTDTFKLNGSRFRTGKLNQQFLVPYGQTEIQGIALLGMAEPLQKIWHQRREQGLGARNMVQRDLALGLFFVQGLAANVTHNFQSGVPWWRMNGDVRVSPLQRLGTNSA